MTPNPFDLTGKVALVTGASRGLGLGFAKTLAQAGANLAITSRSLESLDGPAKELEALGAQVEKVVLDVRDQESIKSAVASTIQKYGQIDILMNNAGCNVRKPALEVEWDDWNLILDTNLRGVFFVAQEVARHMAKRNYGRIINVGSVTCVAGYAGLGPYGASRGGTKQLTMSLAHDWGEYGITVNCLAPGWFKTDQNKVMYQQEGWVEYLCERIPLGRPGAPGDLAGALLLLASDASAYITGQTLLIDGGISVGAVRATVAKK